MHIVAASGFSDLISRMGSRRISAWDQALFWCHAQSVAFCWLIEDDVLWDSPSTLSRLVSSFAAEPAGLIAHSMQDYVSNPGSWAHNDSCRSILGPVVFTPAFCPLSRVSRALLASLAAVGREKGRLCFLEVLLPAVAARSGLGVVLYDELPLRAGLPRLALRFRPPFNASDLAAHAYNVYHPVKSLQRHQ